MSNVVFAAICAVIALFSALQSRPHSSEFDPTEQVDTDDFSADDDDSSHK
jgi:hypothetical protein